MNDTAADHDETRTTVTGLAPSVIRALRQAAVIAAEHGHNWIGDEDLLAALLGAGRDPGNGVAGCSVVETRWRMAELGSA